MDPEEMSLRQAREFNERAAEILAMEGEEVADIEAARPEERAGDVQVREQVLRQLRQAGRSPDVAAQEAEVFAAFLRTMADRTSEDILDLARTMPVQIRGPIAEAARKRGDLDRRLNALRRDPERATAPRGGSLLEWVREQGGISDRGGDIEAMDAPRGAIAETAADVRDRLSQPTLDGMPREGRGLSLDDLGSAAIAEGYFPDAEMVEFAEELSRREIDLSLSNDEIAAALGEGRELGQEAAVAEVSGEEFTGGSIREVRQADQAWYRENLVGKEVTSREGWTVTFNRRGLRKSTSKGEDLLQVIPAIPAVIEEGRVVDSRPGRDPTTKAMHFIAAPVNIAGEVKDVVVAVRETPDGKFQYDLTWDSGERAQPGADGDLAQATVDPVWNQPSPDLNIGVLDQSFNADGRRGSIQFPKGGLRDGQTVVNLFENADLSTFLHEKRALLPRSLHASLRG